MKRNFILLLVFFINIIILSCNLPLIQNLDNEPTINPDSYGENLSDSTTVQPLEPITFPAEPPASDLITTEDLTYIGAFRLPDASGDSSWEYSGHALTYYPSGDPGGSDDGFPGSLYGVGHDHQLYVSEISIPEPVISKNLDDLNTATTLQPFQDITNGAVTEYLALPRLGLEYLPPQGEQTSAKLHFSLGQHIQDFEPSHGWSEIDLSEPQTAGLWVFDGITNYASNDYIFEIPEEWANAISAGYRLASGRFREGVWGGGGPALFAYSPWQDGNPPKKGSTLSAVKPLLLFGIQEPGMPDIIVDESMQMDGYQESDHWLGGAWLTAGDKSAVIFTGTKALGRSWYGYANGVIHEHDCAEQNPPTCPDPPEWPYDNRGYWAEDYQAQIIFFNPYDLVKVANGEMESYKPQPYAALDISDVLFDPDLHLEEYRRDFVTAAAFDRANGHLFVIEKLADEYKSVIHVWQIE